MSEWISVKDRMPVNNGSVLTWGNDCLMVNGYYARTTLWTLAGAQRGITHWMPIPERPESEAL